MGGEAYIPPCRAVLRARVTCKACQKTISLHCLKYRHVCQPMVDCIRRGTEDAHAAVQHRAEAALEAERAD
eukprot:12312598-Alexandrium_andersonii.AAC.1